MARTLTGRRSHGAELLQPDALDYGDQPRKDSKLDSFVLGGEAGFLNKQLIMKAR